MGKKPKKGVHEGAKQKKAMKPEGSPKQRRLGTTVDPVRGGQYYDAHAGRNGLERSGAIADLAGATTRGTPKAKGTASANAFIGAIEATTAAEFRSKRQREKENKGAKARVGKNRGGK